MADFVDLPFSTVASDYEDMVVAYLQSVWTDWVPADGDPETIWIESLAPLAVDLGGLISNVPLAAIIAFGVKLLGQPYGTGQSAYTTVQFTVQDNLGYTIPAGSGLAIDGYGFVVVNDVDVLAGTTQANGLVASNDQTASANGLTGMSVTPVAMPGFVTGMTVLGPTTAGADPQTDTDYANQISRDRRLTSKTLVTPLDYELEALDIAGIGRAHADVATGRNVTVTLLSNTGTAVPSPVKATLAAAYAAAKSVNAVVTLADPTFTTVNVTYTAQAETGFDHTDLLNRINAALTQELSPLSHGVPQSGDPGNAVTTWINDPAIYAWRLVQVIGAVAGVHRVELLSINGGANGADLALSGAVPVPEPGTMVGTIV